MTNTRAINAAAGVIHACIQQGKPLPASQAYALDAAGLLNSPEIAAELVLLRARVAVLEAAAYGDAEVRLLSPVEQIRHLHACVAAQMARAETLDRLLREYQAKTGDGSTRTVDEDPIAYALTPEALHASSGAVIEIPDRPRDGVYRQGTAHRQQMRDLIAGQRAALGNHDGPPHHDYTIGRDLPEVTP
jgi:hypothetical protein